MTKGEDKLRGYITGVLYGCDVSSEVSNNELAQRILTAITQDEFYIDSEGVYEVIESDNNGYDDGIVYKQICYEGREDEEDDEW